VERSCGENTDYRLYKLPCNHIAEKTTAQVLAAEINCAVCLEEKLHDEAKNHGLVLLGEGVNSYHRHYKLKCDHEINLLTSNVRKGSFGCSACVHERIVEDALKANVELVGGSARGKQYRAYKMKCCGHIQDIQPGVIRHGYFRCRNCNISHLDRPSTVYLLRIENAGQQWLKLGYAENIEKRINEYGLSRKASTKLISNSLFETGAKALIFENYLHKEFIEYQINPNLMKAQMSKSGHTECYSADVQEAIKTRIIQGPA
jgi:hypothetical protein